MRYPTTRHACATPLRGPDRPTLCSRWLLGATVIWDLKHNREAISIVSQTSRPHVSAIAWNPSTPMQIVTASEDDYDPSLLVWDLRNARYASSPHPRAVTRRPRP